MATDPPPTDRGPRDPRVYSPWMQKSRVGPTTAGSPTELEEDWDEKRSKRNPWTDNDQDTAHQSIDESDSNPASTIPAVPVTTIRLRAPNFKRLSEEDHIAWHEARDLFERLVLNELAFVRDSIFSAADVPLGTDRASLLHSTLARTRLDEENQLGLMNRLAQYALYTVPVSYPLFDPETYWMSIDTGCSASWRYSPNAATLGTGMSFSVQYLDGFAASGPISSGTMKFQVSDNPRLSSRGAYVDLPIGITNVSDETVVGEGETGFRYGLLGFAPMTQFLGSSRTGPGEWIESLIKRLSLPDKSFWTNYFLPGSNVDHNCIYFSLILRPAIGGAPESLLTFGEMPMSRLLTWRSTSSPSRWEIQDFIRISLQRGIGSPRYGAKYPDPLPIFVDSGSTLSRGPRLFIELLYSRFMECSGLQFETRQSSSGHTLYYVPPLHTHSLNTELRVGEQVIPLKPRFWNFALANHDSFDGREMYLGPFQISATNRVTLGLSVLAYIQVHFRVDYSRSSGQQAIAFSRQD